MGAPINSFEIVESIRFFAQLVGTEGISEEAKRMTSNYIDRLLPLLERDIQETIASRSNIKLVK